MPRLITNSFRQEVEARYSDEVDLIFITITHPLLLEDIRVNWDTKNFIYQGQTFIGFPFDVVLLTDDDGPPKAQVEFQNVDSGIGETIRTLPQGPRLTIEFLHSSDFDLTVTPRTPIGTPDVVLRAAKLFLTNCKVDVLTISGDLTGYDFSQRVFPGRRATQADFPALFI